jgi:hypothetical protein
VAFGHLSSASSTSHSSFNATSSDTGWRSCSQRTDVRRGTPVANDAWLTFFPVSSSSINFCCSGEILRLTRTPVEWDSVSVKLAPEYHSVGSLTPGASSQGSQVGLKCHNARLSANDDGHKACDLPSLLTHPLVSSPCRSHSNRVPDPECNAILYGVRQDPGKAYDQTSGAPIDSRLLPYATLRS